LMVKVDRHKSIGVAYQNEALEPCKVVFEDALSELFQHEYDHLNGVLCTMRAKDQQSFLYRNL
jgi:peptide deformylase